MTLSISCMRKQGANRFTISAPAGLGQTENDLRVFGSFVVLCRKRNGADARTARGEDRIRDGGSHRRRRRLAYAGRRDVAVIFLHYFRWRVLNVRVNLR